MWLIGSLIYFVSPIDLVPDVPIIGHIDDVLLTLISTLNLTQAYVTQSSKSLAQILRILKIGLIVFTVFSIGMLMMMGAALIVWLT